ncbi:glycoside hydrolase family 3 N-terminal domain-containing protein [Streptomyces sp. TP-A0874]|uniref:beta-xylosidase/alpha-l-arabinosidase n=1 Tax=Streptomyces sp. TP-A0874 TaxID=549819 RepID=UPI000852AB15|nr:glycoside hydrolase family 3 N-terminal domain-containing protein [Streptomyces sp. TP-A0874]
MPNDHEDLARWQDVTLPVDERVADLLRRMTLEEKLAQLGSIWPGGAGSGADVAPHQHELMAGKGAERIDWEKIAAPGLGQLTRPFGTAPVDPTEGAGVLARTQARIAAANRFGIPAIAHEECLAGFTAWQATVYPTPLAWGATFNPVLVRRMAERIGADMRSVGIHQGLAPVLDVTRDPRWGRTEETIGEDPYLVATLGSAYVSGLQSAGVIATLKHFVGYSASRAARNQAPVSMGPREMADVLLPPFEMALREGGARSVMHSYSEVDGVPAAADRALLTGLLRDVWGFTGTVVADYFGVSFLESLHRVADSAAAAAELALRAGVDVELPDTSCYGAPLHQAVREGGLPEELVDRSVLRVLRHKCELGLLDPDWDPVPDALRPAGPGPADPTDGDRLDAPAPATPPAGGTVDLDRPEARALARQVAEQSVVLLANTGALPLPSEARIALVGPLADDPAAMFGCYSFPSHVGGQHPDVPLGLEVPTLLESLRAELPAATVDHAVGCGVSDEEDGRLATAVRLASEADVCVAVLGDRAGLFGRGTSGEGCDAEDLALPGVQGRLLDELLATGTPVVLVLFTGRPYALGRYTGRLAAAVQSFFPGEEGGPAVAGVLSGRVCPSGRLPVSVPREPGGLSTGYLAPRLGRRHEGSSVDPTALFPFGHGLSYTSFDWTRVRVDGAPVPEGGESAIELPTDGEVTVALSVRNSGDRAGTEVVQLYLHDPAAQVTRPVVRLLGYARVPLEPGERAEVAFKVHTDLTSFTGRTGSRVVEPGDLELRLSASSELHRHTVRLRLTGEERTVDHRRRLRCEALVR